MAKLRSTQRSWLIEEALSYKFALDKDRTPTSKPVDGNDHGITALEFSIMICQTTYRASLEGLFTAGHKIIHDKKNNGIIKRLVGSLNPREDTDNVPNNLITCLIILIV